MVVDGDFGRGARICGFGRNQHETGSVHDIAWGSAPSGGLEGQAGHGHARERDAACDFSGFVADHARGMHILIQIEMQLCQGVGRVVGVSDGHGATKRVRGGVDRGVDAVGGVLLPVGCAGTAVRCACALGDGVLDRGRWGHRIHQEPGGLRLRHSGKQKKR